MDYGKIEWEDVAKTTQRNKLPPVCSVQIKRWPSTGEFISYIKVRGEASAFIRQYERQSWRVQQSPDGDMLRVVVDNQCGQFKWNWHSRSRCVVLQLGAFNCWPAEIRPETSSRFFIDNEAAALIITLPADWLKSSGKLRDYPKPNVPEIIGNIALTIAQRVIVEAVLNVGSIKVDDLKASLQIDRDRVRRTVHLTNRKMMAAGIVKYGFVIADKTITMRQDDKQLLMAAVTRAGLPAA